MKYKNEEYRAREAHAHASSQSLGHQAGWTFTSQLALLPPVLRQGFYDPDAHLVVMGLGGNLPWGLKAAVAETRCTALMLQPGFTAGGSLTCYFTLLRCSEGQVHWHSGRQLWADRNDGLFLIPDLLGDDPMGPCFALENREIFPCSCPPAALAESSRGLGRGAQILMIS